MNYLTGGRRYRSTYAGLILQVSFCYWSPESFAWRNDWRDADVHDLHFMEIVSE